MTHTSYGSRNKWLALEMIQNSNDSRWLMLPKDDSYNDDGRLKLSENEWRAAVENYLLISSNEALYRHLLGLVC